MFFSEGVTPFVGVRRFLACFFISSVFSIPNEPSTNHSPQATTRPDPGDEYKVLVGRGASGQGPFYGPAGNELTQPGTGQLVLGSHDNVYAPGGECTFHCVVFLRVSLFSLFFVFFVNQKSALQARASSSTPSAAGTSSCTTTFRTTPSAARRTSASTTSTSPAGGRLWWTERLLPGNLQTSPTERIRDGDPWARVGQPRTELTTSNLSSLGHISGIVSAFALVIIKDLELQNRLISYRGLHRCVWDSFRTRECRYF